MKKLFLIALVAMLGFSSCKYDDSDLWNKVNEYGESIKDHENRIVALEEACKQINTNVKALQVLVNAIDVGDYITSITPVMKDGEEVGYAISFSQSNPITIYHGQDGENGIDGVDGKDGYTPKIGVKKYTDGIYYWTLDGTWLLDSNNQRIQAVGIDGKDGVDGTDGKNGANGKDGVDGTDGKNGANGKDGVNGTDGKDGVGVDGTDGKDGITPRLKIENDYWYVSYDNGATWVQLGKATGEDGKDGTDGSDGDSIFKSVTQDDEYVYFNLADGTMITLPKHDKENVQFEDLQVKAICCKNWDTNNDGELSYAEAAAVETIGTVFSGNTNIIAFTELGYFTGIIEIPNNAFKGCTALWKIVLPENVESIGNSAFSKCKGIVNINIPNEVKSIDNYAFSGCSSLINFNIPSSVSWIGQEAFYECSSLTKMIIPDNVTTIEKSTFSKCISLLDVTIGKGIQSIDYGAFVGCSNLEKIIIGEGVVSIGKYAFAGCNKLTSITIPQSVKSIDELAFEITTLTTLYCKPTTPPAIYHKANGAKCIYPYKQEVVVYVPRDSYDTYKMQDRIFLAGIPAKENFIKDIGFVLAMISNHTILKNRMFNRLVV